MARWPFRWGAAAWGGPFAVDLKSIALPGLPPSALILWTAIASTPADMVWQVYVNGRLVAVTSDTRYLVVLEAVGVFYFEVIGVRAGVDDADFRSALEVIPGDRAQLTWSPSAKWGAFKWGYQGWGKTDATLYHVYWDAGLGGPLTFLAETSHTTYTSGRLEDGTYVFRIDPLDAAGNRRVSSRTRSITVLRMPDPVTDFMVTGYDAGTTTFSATWTAPATAGVTEYRIYSNGGSGPIDYSTPVATIAAPATGGSWVETGSAGDWAHAIRVVKGALEETNVHARHEYELGGSPLDVLGLQPAPVLNLQARAIEAGAIRLAADYPAMAEASIGTAVRIYYDAGTGTISYAAPLLSIDIPAHSLGGGGVMSILGETGALTHGTTYLFVARAVDAAGRESEDSAEVSAIADAVAPPPIYPDVALVIATPLLEGVDA